MGRGPRFTRKVSTSRWNPSNPTRRPWPLWTRGRNSPGGTTMDPAPSSIRNQLQSMFNYSSYRMVDRLKRSLSVGETGEFVLPGNRSMRVTPAPAKGDKVRLAVQVMEGERNLVSTTLGLSRGGMGILGGPSYPKGVLILLISAE